MFYIYSLRPRRHNLELPDRVSDLSLLLTVTLLRECCSLASISISCASDSSHPGSAWSKHGAKASLLSHTIETGLLQLAFLWCPNRGGVEAAAPAEQRCRIVLKANQRSDMRRTAAATTSLAARRKSTGFQNCITDLGYTRCDRLRRHRTCRQL